MFKISLLKKKRNLNINTDYPVGIEAMPVISFGMDDAVFNTRNGATKPFPEKPNNRYFKNRRNNSHICFCIRNRNTMDKHCTDSTVRLTLDKIVLEQHLNLFGNDDEDVLKWAYLNSFHQSRFKNVLDIAILAHIDLHDYLKVEEHYVKVDKIPFDVERRRMSVILQQRNGKHLLICKGAVEEILRLCTHAFVPGEDKQLHIETDLVIAMDKKLSGTILQTSKRLQGEGLKVLVVAIREFDDKALPYSAEDEKEMILTGFICFRSTYK